MGYNLLHLFIFMGYNLLHVYFHGIQSVTFVYFMGYNLLHLFISWDTICYICLFHISNFTADICQLEIRYAFYMLKLN